MLTFSWGELEQVLGFLAASERQRDLVQAMLSGIQSSDCDRLERLRLVMTAAFLVQTEDPDREIEKAKAVFLTH